MNLQKLQNSTSNARCNTKSRSIVKFFSLGKILNKIFHHTKKHTKSTKQHIQKHHKKYIGIGSSAVITHLLIFKLATIKIIGIKAIIILLTSIGAYNNGLEHHVSANNNTGNLTSGGMTISTWIKFSEQNNTTNIVSKNSEYILKLHPHSNSKTFRISFNLYHPTWDDIGLSRNQRIKNNYDRYHIAATYDKNFMKLFVNGELLAQKTATGEINITNHTQTKGILNSGTIADIKSYNYPLSSGEILTIFNSGVILSGEVNNTGTTETIKDILENQGFFKQNGKRSGNNNLNTNKFNGKICEGDPLLINGDNNGFVELPGCIRIKNNLGQNYTGTIQKPQETEKTVANELSNIEIKKVVRIGNNSESIEFQNNNGTPEKVKVAIGINEGNIGDKLNIYFSHDEINRQYLTSSIITEISGNKVIEFYTTHFTTFVLASQTGEFYINNDDTYTTGLNTTLTISGSNITHMRFGNTTGERDSALRESYSNTKSRTLTGEENGTKTVYAEFSGGGGTVTTQDTIILNQNKLLTPGHINIQGMDWQTIEFNQEYLNTPIVIATPQTDNNNNNYPIPTIKNITTTGFQIASCVDMGELTCSTGSTEEFGYFIFDTDRANEYNWIEVGTSSIATDGTTTNISLSSNFTHSPILRTTPQTYNQNGNIAAIARVNDNTTTTGASLIGCVHQGTADTCTTGQPNEYIGYIAIDTGNIDANIIQTYQDGMQDISSSTWTPITFSPNYIQPKIMVTQNDDDGGQDTEYPWARDILSGSADIRYCEQDGVNDCDSHTSEKTYRFAVETYDLYTLPTATIEYNAAYITGQTTPYDVIATLTGFNKDLITITNNGWSKNFTFTGNGTFTFEFKDAAGNTGSTTATVTWIDKSAPAIISTKPNNGNNATTPAQDVIIKFTKPMNTGSVESGGVIEIIPENTGRTYSRNGNEDTITISHNDFNFDTDYTITINTGAKDRNNAGLLEQYMFSFKTMQNLPLIKVGHITNLTGLTRHHIDLEHNYDTPPIILSTPVTDNGENNYPIPTITNVTTSGFDIAICIDGGLTTCSTSMTGENIDYFVFNKDISQTLDWIEVGKISTSTDGATTNLGLSSNFSNIPNIRTTSQTYNQNGNIATIARVNDNQTISSAEIIGCVHQGTANTCTTGQPNEDIGYVAIDTNNVNITGFQNGEQSISNSEWTAITFSPNYIWPRIMVTQNDDAGAQDPEYPWARNITTSGSDIRYCEADGTNYCDSHAAEKMSRFAIEGYDLYTLPSATVNYSPEDQGGIYKTSGDVISTLTGYNKSGIIITNNGGSDIYTFTGNGIFTFQFEDLAGNTGEATAIVNRIDKTIPTATISYNPTSGSITSGDVIATLTGFSESGIVITNNGGLNSYTFTGNGIFTFQFEDLAGNTGETTATVDRIDKTIPIIISSSPSSGEQNIAVNQDIILNFNSNMNHSSVETNLLINPSLDSTGFIRSGDNTLIISHNNLEFNAEYTLNINIGAKNYISTHMQNGYNLTFKTRGETNISYNINGFNESLNNDGSITGDIIILLTGDTFSTGVVDKNYINTKNIPAGLTSIFNRDSDTQITMTLIDNATNHTDADDINNISISFTDDAFTSYNSGEVQNSSKSNISIDFLDPYQQLQIIPVHDNLLDADTEPANGCDNGMCQEANYGGLTYGGCSDFGSTQIMKFDLSNIGNGSTIYSATFRMTKMDLDIGTGFEIKQIINNPDWIEGVGDQAGANAEKALTGESNFKQRKRAQEDWNNGNPGLIEEYDYKSNNIIINPEFDTQGNETKTFELNSTGIDMLQEWIDTPQNNHGFAMMNADKNWLIIRTSEYSNTNERPLLNINYIPDQTRPKIISTTPLDNAIDISTTTNLSVEFSEKIYANTGYNIYIKKTINDSTIQTIDAISNSINIDNNALTVVIDPIDFESNTGYYILIDSGAFQDVSANTFTGISDKTIWNFTTINTDNIPKLSTTYYTDLTSTSATMGGAVTSAGSGNITERGIYRSLVDGFSDGDGTKVSNIGSRTNTGLFILPVDGFSSGTQIYFKTFAVNSYGTGYSTSQGSFITKPNTPTINITDTSNKSFRVNRDDIIGADNYELYISTNVGFTSLITGYAPMTGITNNTYLANGLDVETNYFVKLVAINSGGSSIDSNIVNTTTTYTPTPTAHLKFEESNGSIAYDSVSSHDGILEGDPFKLQTGAADEYAYNFDGIDDALSIVDFNYGPELSVYFRIKQSSAGDDEFIFSHGAETDPSSINVYFNDTNQQLITSINGNTGTMAITGESYTGLLDNERHLYVLTIDYGAITGKIQSKIYLDGQLATTDKSIDTPASFDPNTNIVLGRRGNNTAGTYYNGYIDDFRMYNQYLLESEVNQLYLSTLDDIPPTATINYNPGSGEQTTSNVIATLTGFSESGVIITNNLGQANYTFTENGSFIFEFKDAAGNTGSTTANVTWIVTGTLDIGIPNEFTFSGSIKTREYDQILTGQYTGNNYFSIDDQLGLDRGRYTTISATDLTGDNYSDTITNDNLLIKADGIQKLSGDINTGVEINNLLLSDYTPLSGQLNYIFRNTDTNDLKRGEYGDQPYLKINFPAFKPADNYHGQLIFTIYEN